MSAEKVRAVDIGYADYGRNALKAFRPIYAPLGLPVLNHEPANRHGDDAYTGPTPGQTLRTETHYHNPATKFSEFRVCNSERPISANISTLRERVEIIGGKR